MIFNLHLANIANLLCFFFLFRDVFSSFLIIPVKIENQRLKIALAIPTGAPITVVNDSIQMLPVVTDKTINDLSKWLKEEIYLLSLLLINSFSLMILFSLNCC